MNMIVEEIIQRGPMSELSTMDALSQADREIDIFRSQSSCLVNITDFTDITGSCINTAFSKVQSPRSRINFMVQHTYVHIGIGFVYKLNTHSKTLVSSEGK